MMISIKSKFIVSMSVLIICILTLASVLLIKEKKEELTSDIYIKARSFAELSSSPILKSYQNYLKEGGGFLLFNKDLQSFFKKNEDISSISLANYSGEILYDSISERERQYNGESRKLDDEMLKRVKGQNISLSLDSGRVIYLKKENNEYIAVNDIEKLVEKLNDTERINDLIVPIEDEYAVVFGLSYQNLDKRIIHMKERIIYIALFGILFALMLGYFLADSISRPIKLLTNKVSVIAKGNFESRVDIKSRDEVGILAESVNSMAKDLQKSMKAMVYKERVAKELELAAQIQNDILPKEIPHSDSIDIAAALYPATEIGGDCYDFIVNDKGDILGYLGDVTGHGVPSGIVVAIANALIYNLSSKEGLRDILLDTNVILTKKTSPSMFLTMLMFNWSENNRRMTYCSAGHEQPLLYKAAQQKVVMLEKGGMALGMMPDISKFLSEKEIELEKGDVFVVYTDGIPEAWKNEKENYGMGRFKRAISEYATLESATEIKKALIKDVRTFIGDNEQKDDITLLVIKRI